MGVAGDALFPGKALGNMPRIKPGAANRNWDTVLAMMWLIHGPEPLEQRTPEAATERFTVDPARFREALEQDGVLAMQAESAGIIVPVEERGNPLFGNLESALSEKRSQATQIELLERCRASTLQALERHEEGEGLEELIALCADPEASHREILRCAATVSLGKGKLLQELKHLNSELSRLTGLEYSQSVATHLGKSQATKHQELRSPPQREARIVDF